MLHIRTPLILHHAISSPDRRIWLKLENLQPSGSFKLRGIGLLCSQAAAAGKERVVCASGGNAGFATAFATAKLGLQAYIIVPETTSAITRQRISQLGAIVEVHGKVWDESNDLALEWSRELDAEYIPAFDHPTLWAGHSTMIDEIVETQVEFDSIVAAVGGGGLVAGLMTGLQRHGRTDCRIVTCETEGAASFSAALKAGRPVRLPEINTIASCLGASEVATWPVDAIRQFPHESVVLPDSDALMGVVRYADDLRQLVEPACGVSLAVGYLDHPSIASAQDVIIVVCGGVSVSADLVSQWGHP